MIRGLLRSVLDWLFNRLGLVVLDKADYRYSPEAGRSDGMKWIVRLLRRLFGTGPSMAEAMAQFRKEGRHWTQWPRKCDGKYP